MQWRGGWGEVSTLCLPYAPIHAPIWQHWLSQQRQYSSRVPPEASRIMSHTKKRFFSGAGKFYDTKCIFPPTAESGSLTRRFPLLTFSTLNCFSPTQPNSVKWVAWLTFFSKGKLVQSLWNETEAAQYQ